MNVAEILQCIESKTGHKLRGSGHSYSGLCPAHKDKNPSFSISQSNTGTILMHCHAGCTFDEICNSLNIDSKKLFPSMEIDPSKIERIEYTYHDEKGNILYRKIRGHLEKKFFFERYENSVWKNGLESIRRVLYNLPEVQLAIQNNRPVVIVEGEKDAETLRRHGYVATTNDSGAGPNKWKKEYSECLKNAHVLLFYDYDQAGAQHRDNIITQLQVYAASIKVIHLPGFEIQDKHGLDVTDWLQRGHTFSELEKLIQDAPLINFFSPSKTEADRIKAVSAEELIEMKIEQPETLLHPFITKSSLGMIYAQRGIGKTFFTLSLGMAVASGGQFLKYSAPKPYKVLYLDGEMSIFSMQDRISKAYSSQKNKPPKNYFKLVNAFLQDLPLPDLATSEGQRALQPLINDSDLIIVDNLSCWVTSGAENEGESWLPILQWALKQRRQGKAVIFIHHSNKKNGQRGSSRKEDALDYVIKLDKLEKYDNKEGACFGMSFEKNRSWLGSDVESLNVKLIDTIDGKREWEWSATRSDGMATEISKLKAEGKTVRDIAKELNISASTVSRRSAQ
ncbi:MAG: AAA family ATPase [Parachlamydiaceae bacterium]